MNRYLFIYGTLIPDIAPDDIADTTKKLRFVGEGFVYGELYDLGEYPAAILNTRNKIFGRVYEVPDDQNVLQALDEYEGFYPRNISKSLYLRKKVNVYLENKTLSCWIYEYNRDVSNAPVIESGNFLTLQNN